jgi:hypothetical protein
MGTLFLVLLTIIFLLLAVSLIWSQWHWSVKALLILSTLFVGISANTIWFITQGYAHSAPLPDKFLLAHTMTREPNPRNQDPGAIYYVVIEPSGKQLVPRLYSKAYSESDQRDSSELQKRIKDQNSPIWVEKTKETIGEDTSDQESSLKSGLRGVAAGFGYYEDDARHGLVPMSSPPPLKQ